MKSFIRLQGLSRSSFCRVFACLLILLGGLGSQPLALAQGGGVEGVVLDAASAVVSGAQVSLTSESGGEPLRTKTNAAGMYHFPTLTPGAYKLKVEAPGFEPYERRQIVATPHAMQHVNAQLKVHRDAQEVRVVSATGQEQLLTDAPASVSLITREDIETKPVYNVGDLLMQAPGVNGNYGVNGETNKVGLRGLDSTYTLILVDGKRIGSSSLSHYRSDLAYQDLNWISPEMIDHIEVLRGPMSTLYGSDAMGGVINIITKKISDRWRFTANADFTKSGDSDRGSSTSESILASGPVGKRLNVRGAYSFTQQNADNVVIGSGYTNGRSGERNQTANGSAVYVLNRNHSLTGDLQFGLQHSMAPDLLSSGAAQSAYGANDLRRISWDVGHNGDWGAVGKSSLTLSRSAYNNTVSGSTMKNDDLILDGTLDTVLAKGWLGSHLIRSGGQYHRMGLTNTMNIGTAPILPDGSKISDASLSGYSTALFSEDTVALRKNVLLTFGGRWDHDYKFGDSFEPRGYIVYHPLKDWTARGGVSRGFRAPSITESSPAAATKSGGGGCSSLAAYGYSSGGCYIIGNASLKPETSLSYEVGGGYSRGKLQLDATFFWTEFNNKIQNVPLGKYNGYWYMQKQNVERARTRGMEFTTSAPLTRYARVRSNWTWMMEDKNLTTGDMLIVTPELSGWNALDVNPTRKLSLQYAVRYTGKQMLTTTGMVAGRSSNAIVNSYNITDLSGSYKLWKETKVRMGVNNLYQTNVSATTGYTYYQPRRSFSFGMVSNF